MKDNFAVDVEKIPFIPVCCDDEMKININLITCDELGTEVAPGCLVSIQTQKNVWKKVYFNLQDTLALFLWYFCNISI